ncbi:plasmid transfer protein TraA [Streptomyces sp. NPDC090112]|uniref:plasmid transfer protein TraA n=1 Tax=Streptomyces sp. NPDC090112 TaxID=3365949 RepID=UPI00382CAA04
MATTNVPPQSNPAGKGGRTKQGPTINLGPHVTVNSTRAPRGANGHAGAVTGHAGGGNGKFMLPEPVFGGANDIRTYCNALRAFGVHASIEVAVAVEILKAALSQAQGLPDDNVIQHKLRARKVARKLSKAADALAEAAAAAAATYAAFQREYASVAQARPTQHTPRTRPFTY